MRAATAIAAVGMLAPAVVDAQDGSGSVSVSVPNLAPYVSPYIGPEATGGTVASCPAGQIVVGVAGTNNQTQPIRALQIRATASVKALSIICDELF